MRLKDMALLLVEVENELKFDAVQVTGTNTWSISQHTQILAALRRLTAARVLVAQAEAVLAFRSIVENVEDQIVVNADTSGKFNSAISNLRTCVKLLAPVLGELQAPDDELTLSVRLPEKLDLSALADITTILDNALKQALLNPVVDGNPKFIGFDRGSDWLLISLGSSAGARLIKVIIDQFLTWREKSAEIELKAEAARSLQIANDFAEKFNEVVLSAIEAEKFALRETMDRELYATVDIPDSENELKLRIVKSRDSLWEILERGAELHLQLTSGQEVVSRKSGKVFGAKNPKALPSGQGTVPKPADPQSSE